MTKQKINQKLLFLLVAVVLALVLLFALEKLKITDFIHKKTPVAVQGQGPTVEQKAAEDKANSDAKKDFIEGTSQNGSNNTTTPTQSSSVELSARQEANNTVTVLTKLYAIPSGTCTLTITNNGSAQNYTADVIYQPEYSTCAGFSVPIHTAGNWNLQLSVNSGGQTYAKSVTYQVK